MLESALQSQVVGYLQTQRITFFAVPNGLFIHGSTAAERARRGAILKRRGALQPGAPDLVLCLKGGRFGAIELKVKDNDLTPAQEAMRTAIEKSGGMYAVCKSVEEVKGTLAAWLCGQRAAA